LLGPLDGRQDDEESAAQDNEEPGKVEGEVILPRCVIQPTYIKLNVRYPDISPGPFRARALLGTSTVLSYISCDYEKAVNTIFLHCFL
jgi:hypothetical protein